MIVNKGIAILKTEIRFVNRVKTLTDQKYMSTWPWKWANWTNDFMQNGQITGKGLIVVFLFMVVFTLLNFWSVSVLTRLIVATVNEIVIARKIFFCGSLISPPILITVWKALYDKMIPETVVASKTGLEPFGINSCPWLEWLRFWFAFCWYRYLTWDPLASCSLVLRCVCFTFWHWGLICSYFGADTLPNRSLSLRSQKSLVRSQASI